ncbi:MAG: hypothetical protein GM48_0070 [actinobacterium acIB-AMD-7]|nr:MAG: hypothetical protein GM48_0070 [actinobacterium acIB-AMD-7]
MKNVLLIYIPCHKDFKSAITQAKKIRKYYKGDTKLELQNSWEIKLILSVNDYLLQADQKKLANFYFDQVIDYGKIFLFDVNIMQGFLKAIEFKPDLLWILSTNDLVNTKSLETIFSDFSSDRKLDLLVAGSVTSRQEMKISNIDSLFNSDYQFGLISGVVYNFQKFGKFFNAAPFFTWTGWGHLSVIINAIQARQEIFVSIVPKSCLFDPGSQSSNKNSKYYSHSYFGRLILIQLINKSSNSRKREIRKFVYKNYYLHNYFNIIEKTTNLNSNLISIDNYLNFNKRLTCYIIKAQTPFTYYVFRILTVINFTKLKKYSKYIGHKFKSA